MAKLGCSWWPPLTWSRFVFSRCLTPLIQPLPRETRPQQGKLLWCICTTLHTSWVRSLVSCLSPSCLLGFLFPLLWLSSPCFKCSSAHHAASSYAGGPRLVFWPRRNKWSLTHLWRRQPHSVLGSALFLSNINTLNWPLLLSLHRPSLQSDQTEQYPSCSVCQHAPSLQESFSEVAGPACTWHLLCSPEPCPSPRVTSWITSTSGFQSGKVAVGGVQWKSRSSAGHSQGVEVLCLLHHGRKKRITSWHSQTPIITWFLVGFLFAICSRRVGIMLSDVWGGRAKGTEMPLGLPWQLGLLRQPTIPSLSCCWLS